MREIIVENCRNNETICKYIQNKYPSLSRNMLFKALRNKDIKINGKRVNSDKDIVNGDILNIYIDDKYLFDIPKNIEYIYQDENIIIAHKPQGLLSNNEDQTRNIDEPTFDDFVKRDYKDAIICHRLDRNTSGLVIFALNDISHKEILNGFNKNLVHKEYIAYVDGTAFEKDSDTITMYLKKNSNASTVKIYEEMVKNSEKIITIYKVLEKNIKNNYSILNIQIPTGKTHQIRAQMAYINHPLIGDSKYGKNDVNKKFKLKKQLLFAHKYSFSFSKTSPLYYLNDIVVKLDDKYYKNKLGE